MNGKALRQARPARLQQVAHRRGIVEQAQPIHLVQHRKAGSAGERIAGIGMAVLETAHVEHRLDQPHGAAMAPSGA